MFRRVSPDVRVAFGQQSRVGLLATSAPFADEQSLPEATLYCDIEDSVRQRPIAFREGVQALTDSAVIWQSARHQRHEA